MFWHHLFFAKWKENAVDLVVFVIGNVSAGDFFRRGVSHGRNAERAVRTNARNSALSREGRRRVGDWPDVSRKGKATFGWGKRSRRERGGGALRLPQPGSATMQLVSDPGWVRGRMSDARRRHRCEGPIRVQRRCPLVAGDAFSGKRRQRRRRGMPPVFGSASALAAAAAHCRAPRHRKGAGGIRRVAVRLQRRGARDDASPSTAGTRSIPAGRSAP